MATIHPFVKELFEFVKVSPAAPAAPGSESPCGERGLGATAAPAGSSPNSAAAQSASEAFCDECDHPVRLHGKRGCQYERGDRWVSGDSGECLMAGGPCGCEAVTVETFTGSLEEELANQDFIDAVEGAGVEESPWT
jgi:hypothetical protein